MKPPQFKSKSNQGLGSLMAYMIAQKKGEGLQQKMGEGGVLTGGIEPGTGGRYETMAGQDFDVQTTLRKKAGEDALKLQQALPMLKDLEDSYTKAYSNFNGARSGMPGALSATQEFFSGVVGRQNPALRNYIDKLGQYEASAVKLTGDVGNFSASERASATKGFPKATPNLDPSRTFMPDEVDYGMEKIQSLKKLYASKYVEALHVAKTGELTEGYKDWLNANTGGGGTGDTNNGNVEVERQKAIKAIKSGKDAKKIADIFRSRTGQELNG